MKRNLITDVAGLKVGHADDARLASGVTAIVFDEPAVASADVRGGAPGTREIDLLRPEQTVERIDAIVLSGGSAFGLDAPGRRAGLAARAGPRLRGRSGAGADRAGRDPVRSLNGGDKDWGRYPPYRELGYAAAAARTATTSRSARTARASAPLPST